MKPRRRDEVQVDLFPFLSVLACMMGTFMLIALTFVGGKVSNVPEEIGVPHDPSNVPRLIIWDGSVVTVDREDGQVRVPWALASKNAGDNDTAFGELLREIKANRKTHYFFIAVRPSGFGNFRTTLRDVVKKANVRYGHWPVQQNKSISLRFTEPEEGGQP